jgi:hypothetical protein
MGPPVNGGRDIGDMSAKWLEIGRNVWERVKDTGCFVLDLWS